ncbi:MAG: ATP-binding protein, partial [Firmicutes bacterium]|nr:ATP-binding protein [Bacillota bacterium]
MKRITAIAGHYGSGKTEFSVNLALDLKKEKDKVAILDMDIANPYFRSRERQKMMEAEGINVIFNTYGFDITEDLPAITAALRGPLENEEFTAVVDVGGNDSGARVLKQFEKYFRRDDCELLCVLNANRPETDTVEGMLEHLHSIEIETGLKFHGIINNTHLLRETTADDIVKGYKLCRQVSDKLGIPIVWNTCHEDLLDDLKQLIADENIEGLENIYPIKLYMRPSW